MEYDKLVARINELAKKNKECGLSEDEISERAVLRKQYLSRIRCNVKSQLENTYIVDPVSGEKTKVTSKLSCEQKVVECGANKKEVQNPNETTSNESTNANAKEVQKPKENTLPQLSPAELAEKKRKLHETAKFKEQYFEFYDDVKISHREDW